MGSVVRRIWNQMSSGDANAVGPEFWNHRKNVAALLFRVMPVDGEIHASEQARLARILADEFSIEEDEVNALVHEALNGASSTTDIDVLSKTLANSLPHHDKLNLISHMWEMVFADGKLHEYELLLIERVASMLGVDSKEVAALMNSHGLEN